jgi:hypothetical protein
MARLHQEMGSRVLRRYFRFGIERILLREGFSEAAALAVYVAMVLMTITMVRG